MAKAKGKGKKGLEASLLGMPDIDFEERISIPFSLEDVGKLKIGQEVVVTIKGCVKHLDGDERYASIGLEIYDKSFRKTSNLQAESIRELSEDDEDY